MRTTHQHATPGAWQPGVVCDRPGPHDTIDVTQRHDLIVLDQPVLRRSRYPHKRKPSRGRTLLRGVVDGNVAFLDLYSLSESLKQKIKNSYRPKCEGQDCGEWRKGL